MTRARELAKLANTNIFTVSGSNVGLGSTGPTVKLDVGGIIKGDGSELTNVGMDTSYISGIAATFTGNVNIGGVLTYEDVTNVDSVGIITAQSGIRVPDGGVGVAESIFHLNDDNTAIRFPGVDTFTVETAGSERLRITSAGSVLVKTTTASPFTNRPMTLGDAGDASNYLEVRAAPTGAVGVVFSDATTSDNAGYRGSIEYDHTSDYLWFRSAGDERFRIASSGQIGLGGANYGTAGQVLTSNGSGSAVTWEDASGGGGITTEAQVKTTGQTALLDLSNAIDHKVTCTGTVTIDATGGTQEGESHTVRIVNNGTATVGFSTYFLFPSGSVPSLPTADGAISLISFTVHRKGATGISTQLLSGSSVNYS